jgi:hypothetical protein
MLSPLSKITKYLERQMKKMKKFNSKLGILSSLSKITKYLERQMKKMKKFNLAILSSLSKITKYIIFFIPKTLIILSLFPIVQARNIYLFLSKSKCAMSVYSFIKNKIYSVPSKCLISIGAFMISKAAKIYSWISNSKLVRGIGSLLSKISLRIIKCLLSTSFFMMSKTIKIYSWISNSKLVNSISPFLSFSLKCAKKISSCIINVSSYMINKIICFSIYITLFLSSLFLSSSVIDKIANWSLKGESLESLLSKSLYDYYQEFRKFIYYYYPDFECSVIEPYTKSAIGRFSKAVDQLARNLYPSKTDLPMDKDLKHVHPKFNQRILDEMTGAKLINLLDNINGLIIHRLNKPNAPECKSKINNQLDYLECKSKINNQLDYLSARCLFSVQNQFTETVGKSMLMRIFFGCG